MGVFARGAVGWQTMYCHKKGSYLLILVVQYKYQVGTITPPPPYLYHDTNIYAFRALATFLSVFVRLDAVYLASHAVGVCCIRVRHLKSTRHRRVRNLKRDLWNLMPNPDELSCNPATMWALQNC